MHSLSPLHLNTRKPGDFWNFSGTPVIGIILYGLCAYSCDYDEKRKAMFVRLMSKHSGMHSGWRSIIFHGI